MLDYQRIADDVHSALFNNGQDGDDFLRAVAADYSLAVDEVNERLRQCGALLRKGLRSEAIDLCELDPNLLDVVQIVDFPERESWNELLRLHGFAATAALMHDVAADLNEAYALEQPLAALLQRHRLLAMSRGPLRLRLDTLRKLAEGDPDNPIWVKDVQVFEEARLKELEREVPQAIFAGDTRAINALAAEIEGAKWRIGRPEALIQQIVAARSNVASEDGLAEMRRIGELLHAAFVTFDVDMGRKLRAQWDKSHSIWGKFADVEVIEHVAPVLEWLREQDEIAEQKTRHKAEVAALINAIVEQMPFKEVSRLHQEAEGDGELPQSVEKRYREYLVWLEQSARRRTRLMFIAIAAAIMVLIAVVTIVVINAQRAGQADRAFQDLTQFSQDGDFHQAQTYLDKLKAETPRVAEDPRIQELGQELKRRLENEETRHRSFETAIELVRKSIEDRLPDTESLARAGSLAATDDEKNAVRKLEHEIAKMGESVQSKIDQNFLATLKEFKDRTVDAEKGIEENPDACIDKLNHIKIELTKLEDSSPQISAAAKMPAELLRARLKSIEEEVKNVNEQVRQDELITAACEDPAKFSDRLRDYARTYPHARRSAGFLEAASEAPLWSWLAQCNELVQTMGRQTIAGKGRKVLAEDAAKLEKLLEDRPNHPDAESFRLRLIYLKAIGQRIDSDGNPIEAALKPIFEDPLVAGAWMLVDSTGNRYYLLESPKERISELSADGSYGFEYVVGFDLTKKKKALHVREIVPNRMTAPQRTIAEKLDKILSTLADDNWDSSFCGMIEAILTDKETDPLLKMFLLRKVLTIGCQGSVCLRKGFSRYMEWLQESKIPTGVNWIDPDDSSGNENRPIAEAELVKVPSFIEARDATAKEWHSLLQPIGTEFRCIGWLRRKLDGRWQCMTPPDLRGLGKLFVVLAGEPNGFKEKGAVLEHVGRLDQDKASIDAAPGPTLLEGRPVYLAIPPYK